jgi:anti-anti-sigma factor
VKHARERIDDLTGEETTDGADGPRVIDAPGMRLRIIDNDSVAMIQVIGEVDLLGAPALDREIERAEAAGPGLVVDLRRLSYIDSSGLNVLVRAARRAREGGTGLGLLRPDDRVGRVFELAGLDSVLPFVN